MMRLIRSILAGVVEGKIKRFAGTGRPGESFADREYFQHYGFSSRPMPGAEGILLKQGNNIILVASDDRRYRISLGEGEVALYTDEGDHIHMKRGNLVDVKTNVLKVRALDRVEFDTPLVTTTGVVEAELDIISKADIKDHGDSGRSMASMRAKYNGHKHPEDASGDTETPRGGDLM